MAKNYKGSLSLDWFNKQKAILLETETDSNRNGDVVASQLNWINKDESLFYEVDEDGKGLSPFWVDASDLRVMEARPLRFKNGFATKGNLKSGTFLNTQHDLIEVDDDPNIENILIKGDSLLAL